MVSQVHRVKSSVMPFLQSTWVKLFDEIKISYKIRNRPIFFIHRDPEKPKQTNIDRYFDLLPVDWTATPLSVSTDANDKDGIGEEEVRKEEGSEAAHNTEKPKDSAKEEETQAEKETDAAYAQREQEEVGNKLFEVKEPKDSAIKELSQSSKRTETAVAEMAEEMEDGGVSKEPNKTTDIQPAEDHTLKSIHLQNPIFKNSKERFRSFAVRRKSRSTC